MCELEASSLIPGDTYTDRPTSKAQQSRATSRNPAMTPVNFILRYTAVPFAAIAVVVLWVSPRLSAEIDTRQYAALTGAYASFPPDLRRDIADALKSGKLRK